MRPSVFINVAISADGKMDTVERHGAGISSASDKARVLRLRAGADAVMVGGHTLLDEDPKLTVKTAELREERRARGQPENPLKVGVVTRANLNPDGPFMNAGPAERVIFTTAQTTAAQVAILTELGAQVFILGEEKVNLPEALEILYSLGVRRLMVEGGGTLNFELLRAGLVDELYIYIAAKIFGGQSAPTLAAGDGFFEGEALSLQLLDTCVLDQEGGVLIRYRVINQISDRG